MAGSTYDSMDKMIDSNNQTISQQTACPLHQALAGLSVFERAMADFNTKYPAPASRGLGPSTKAERWNGRHAMVRALRACLLT